MNANHLSVALVGLACMALGAPASALTSCHLPRLAEQVECGEIAVPEDRSRADGRRIAIRFVRIPASARPAAPDPLLVLAGGPGQAAIDYAPMLTGAFREVRKRRDILLIDQRGTGRSSPLRCPLPVEAIGRADTAAVQASLRRCASGLEADPRHYHTGAALADFEEVRRALGYRQVSLWGGSYGTRTALMYARRYPSSVRSMVLDSVAPPDVRILLNARQAEAALERLVGDCAADAACRKAFPDLARDLDKVLALPSIGPHASRGAAGAGAGAHGAAGAVGRPVRRRGPAPRAALAGPGGGLWRATVRAAHARRRCAAGQHQGPGPRPARHRGRQRQGGADPRRAPPVLAPRPVHRRLPCGARRDRRGARTPLAGILAGATGEAGRAVRRKVAHGLAVRLPERRPGATAVGAAAAAPAAVRARRGVCPGRRHAGAHAAAVAPAGPAGRRPAMPGGAAGAHAQGGADLSEPAAAGSHGGAAGTGREGRSAGDAPAAGVEPACPAWHAARGPGGRRAGPCPVGGRLRRRGPLLVWAGSRRVGSERFVFGL